MSATIDKVSILQMARGAIDELVDYETTRVINNITDPNTKATANAGKGENHE